MDPKGSAMAIQAPEPPDRRLQRKEFVEALRGCAERLEGRARLVWLFRVFCNMPSKEIAAHPEVGLKPGNVDVILQRTRQAMRACMLRNGYEARDMPPGTFVEMWRVFRFEEGHG